MNYNLLDMKAWGAYLIEIKFFSNFKSFRNLHSQAKF